MKVIAFVGYRDEFDRIYAHHVCPGVRYVFVNTYEKSLGITVDEVIKGHDSHRIKDFYKILISLNLHLCIKQIEEINMKEKIKIRIVKFETGFAAQVLYIDERARPEEGWTYKTINNFTFFGGNIHGGLDTLCKVLIPECNHVRLCGTSKDTDKDIIVRDHFRTNAERDEYIEEFIEALEDWSAHWNGWGTSSISVTVE